MAMTIQKLASQIAKLEGRKSQVSIGNIREVISLLITLEAAHRVKAGDAFEPSEVLDLLDDAATAKAHKQMEKEAKKAAKKKAAK